MTAQNESPNVDKLRGMFESILATGENGEPIYTRTEINDVMAVVFMKSYQKMPLSSQDSDALVAGLLARAGIETEEDVKNMGQMLEAYFTKVPIRQDLLKLVQTALQADEPTKPSLRAGYAISSAF